MRAAELRGEGLSASPTTCWARRRARRRTPTSTSSATWRRSTPSARRRVRSPPCTSMRSIARPGLSVKLSALHPRFEPGKEERLAAELAPRLLTLARAARSRGLSLTIDAEEQDRLDPTLEHFAATFTDPALDGWNGLGLAVQAYGKRAIPVLRWLRRLAERTGKRIPVRLVKGAYWDSEIKWAQERGARRLSRVHAQAAHGRLLPRLHAAAAQRRRRPSIRSSRPTTPTRSPRRTSPAARPPSSSSACTAWARRSTRRSSATGASARPCRIYAPVGGHEDLLAYLVRRLLENGANTSFVNRLADDEAPVAEIIRDPVEMAERERGGAAERRRAASAPARDLSARAQGSDGLALTEAGVRAELLAEMAAALDDDLRGRPDRRRRRRRPAATRRASSPARTTGASASARCASRRRRRPTPRSSARCQGRSTPGTRRAAPARAQILERRRRSVRARPRAADGGDRARGRQDARGRAGRRARGGRLPALLRRRGAPPVRRPGAASRARRASATRSTLNGRGVFACISPWNFPLAIFTGQVAAALAAGNAVLAKPAEQTPITAFLATRLLHEAGVPERRAASLAGQRPPRRGARQGRARARASPSPARTRRRGRSRRRSPSAASAIVPFIAETGGINAMIADSSALPEQVVRDCVRSAFDSAGQRCSAARVLFVQEDSAPNARSTCWSAPSRRSISAIPSTTRPTSAP